jgi:tetratricopeptide (TPR) repeat protein
MLHQLDQGIREQLDATDYETHYNLGLAYKDLELYEKAIEEFRLASNDAAYRVRCASLMGLCYLAKGDPERSVEELLKGLAATQKGTEERSAILYDLATAYEAFGDMKKALETLANIYSERPKFRDIRVRIRDLQARVEKSRRSSR